MTVTRKDYIQPDPIDAFRNGQQNTSNNNNQEGEKEMQLLFTKNATTNMLISGKTAIVRKPYTALDETKYQMETESKRTREESKRISQLREQQLLETITQKRQKVRFMREVIPAQRKLAKLVRPDSKTNAKLAKKTKYFIKQKVKEHKYSQDQNRKDNVHEQKIVERLAVQRRKETQRARYLASFRRPQTARQVESTTTAKLQEDEANVTESLMKDVRKRKKRSKSARRKRTESTTFARSFMSANNATSRHIAKGNAMRRKRQEHLDIQKRVAQARWVTEKRAAVMLNATKRRNLQKQNQIELDKMEYIAMLEWRKSLDVQKLEMARLRKQYNRDLTQLVQRVQRGELDQPLWEVDQPPREMLEKQLNTQFLVPSRPRSRNSVLMEQGNQYGGYNGNEYVMPSRPISRQLLESNATRETPTASFTQGPTMSREINLR